MIIRPLLASDQDDVYACFLEAFSDYSVPMRPVREQFEEMLRRRGYRPDVSVAAFDDGRMVGFTLNGSGSWRGIPSAYDTGTGVVPSHRRRGLARRLMDETLAILPGQEVHRYVLEVLQSNRGAFDLYTGSGFAVTREFQCWSLQETSGSASVEIQPEPVDFPAWEISFDWSPSWQNSTASIRRSRGDRIELVARSGKTAAGFIIVFTANGDVPQFFVRPEFRGHGIGRALFGQALRHSQNSLRLINVDDASKGTRAFLERIGAKRTVRQFEMEKSSL